VGGTREDVTALDVGFRSRDRLLSAHGAKKRHTDCILDIEPRHVLLRSGARDPSFGFVHERVAKAKIERFPREQPADGAAPDTPGGGCRRQHGPEIEGITDCGRSCPTTLLAVARLVCHSESNRGRYAALATVMFAVDAPTCSNAALTVG
jgi:hypothetical protein